MKERHPCFTCHRTRKQRLPRTRTTHQYHALRDLRTNVEKFLWFLEKLHDLLQLFFCLFHTRNVFESHFLCRVVGIDHARLRLTESERLHTTTLLHLSREEPEEEDEKDKREKKRSKRGEPIGKTARLPFSNLSSFRPCIRRGDRHPQRLLWQQATA